MRGGKWRISLFVVVLLLSILLGLQWIQRNQSILPIPEPLVQTQTQLEDLRAYFPAFVGANYQFLGEGMEFATFTRQITFASAEFLQVEDTSGTNLAQVVEYGNGEIKIIWSQEEFYQAYSLLDPEKRTNGQSLNLVPLKAPLQVGSSWRDERFEREIVLINQVVTVPLGTFSDVVVVKTKNPDTTGFIQYEYYAKNMGLIKRESIYVQDGQTHGIVSSLRSIVINP